MIYLAISIAVLIVASVAVAVRMRQRPALVALRQPEPFVFAHVRVLRDDSEVREVAHQVYAREQRIVDAAQRRAAHFGRLRGID